MNVKTNQTSQSAEQDRTFLCNRSDLVPNSGVCVLYESGSEPQQIALFYLPDEEPQLYAVSNYDPIGSANVISRGIVGDVEGKLVVASPLYKQHFNLQTGACLEQDDISLRIYAVTFHGDEVHLVD